MFGLGMGEIIIILVLALIFIGPKKLPDLAKNIGKGLREFQRAKQGLMDQIEVSRFEEDEKKEQEQKHEQTNQQTEIEPDYHHIDGDDDHHHHDEFADDHHEEFSDSHHDGPESIVQEKKDNNHTLDNTNQDDKEIKKNS